MTDARRSRGRFGVRAGRGLWRGAGAAVVLAGLTDMQPWERKAAWQAVGIAALLGVLWATSWIGCV